MGRKKIDLTIRDLESPAKFCLSCEGQLHRKRFKGGFPESEKAFYRRTFCDKRCSDTYAKGKISNAAVEENVKTNKRSKKLRCSRCSLLKDKKTEFVRDKTRTSGFYPWCKQCHVESQKKYGNPETNNALAVSGAKTCPTCLREISGHANRVFCSASCKGRALRWKGFGLTPDNFRELTSSGKCPLCLCNVTRWAIDHDHKTGESMGAVCQRCNQYLLAGAKHDIAVADRLLDFLKNPPIRRLFGQKTYVGPAGTSKMHRVWLWTGKHSEGRE